MFDFLGAGLGAAPPLAGATFFLGLGAVAGIIQLEVEVKITPAASAQLPRHYCPRRGLGRLGFLALVPLAARTRRYGSWALYVPYVRFDRQKAWTNAHQFGIAPKKIL